MHTDGDAFALLRGRRLREGGSILDATPTVFESLGVSIPSHLEGTSLLANGGRP
jgi:bisphosphoglycerate-independent phosphoglycerate mutase (AlkP superfamily)